jgi:hypothetical protein
VTTAWWDKYLPPDDVLLELGRLTWSATNLEGEVHALVAHGMTARSAHTPLRAPPNERRIHAPERWGQYPRPPWRATTSKCCASSFPMGCTFGLIVGNEAAIRRQLVLAAVQ